MTQKKGQHALELTGAEINQLEQAIKKTLKVINSIYNRRIKDLNIREPYDTMDKLTEIKNELGTVINEHRNVKLFKTPDGVIAKRTDYFIAYCNECDIEFTLHKNLRFMVDAEGCPKCRGAAGCKDAYRVPFGMEWPVTEDLSEEQKEFEDWIGD